MMGYKQALELVRIRDTLRRRVDDPDTTGIAELIDRMEQLDPEFLRAECRRWRIRFGLECGLPLLAAA